MMASRAVALERLPHELECCSLVPLFGDEALEDLALVIYRPPQVTHLAVDLHVHLIEVPPPLPTAAHAARPLPADVGSEHRAEPVPPVADRLMGNVDAALGQEILRTLIQFPYRDDNSV